MAEPAPDPPPGRPDDEALTWDASAFLPADHDLPSLRAAAADCQACDLHRLGTRTVFGQGPARADVMLVGEQPGDQEDRAGEPFVGPAGRLLDDALAAAGLDRARLYVTNAVKHFKWVPRGRTRLHATPNVREVRACLPWLRAELAAVRPRVIVCLGATAAQALLGPDFRVTRQRGEPIAGTGLAEVVLATVHPSSILRTPDPEAREAATRAFVEDLRRARALLDRPAGA